MGFLLKTQFSSSYIKIIIIDLDHRYTPGIANLLEL